MNATNAVQRTDTGTPVGQPLRHDSIVSAVAFSLRTGSCEAT